MPGRSTPWIAGLVVAVPLCLLSVGCTWLPLAPADTLPARPVPAGLSGAALQAEEFLIQPGDLLSLQISSIQEQLVEGLPVDARGDLHVPGTGDLAVGGLTRDAAEQRVEQALRRLDRHARVSLRIADARGHRMTVVGAVASQRQVALRPGMRLAEAYLVAAPAGAPTAADATPMADLRGARLVRQGVALPVDLERALLGDPAHDVPVKPGDLLTVPVASARVAILGQVERPMAIAHHDGLRMTEALAQAGGITQGGDRRDLRIIRGTLEAPVVYRADLLAITRGERADVALQPGDVVFVTDHPLETINQGIGLVAGALNSAAVFVALSLTQ